MGYRAPFYLGLYTRLPSEKGINLRLDRLTPAYVVERDFVDGGYRVVVTLVGRPWMRGQILGSILLICFALFFSSRPAERWQMSVWIDAKRRMAGGWNTDESMKGREPYHPSHLTLMPR